MKVSQQFGLNTPSAPTDFKSKVSSFTEYVGFKKIADELYPYSTVFDVPTMVGIEIEVENVNKELALPKFWIQETDGSLRHHGREFKSVPLNSEQSFQALSILWQVLYKASSLKPDFSWRTSIHIHLNALDLEDSELKNLIFLSMVFEGLFFNLVGQDREQSNYCVPLCRSTLMDTIKSYLTGKSSLKSLYGTWNAGSGEGGHGLYKYAAINFSRLADLGTVEFRHLGGTNDLQLVFRWLAILLQMYRAAVAQDPHSLHEKIKNLNTNKEYTLFVEEIFGKKISKFFMVKDFKELLYPNVTKAKEMFAMPPKFQGCSADSALSEYGEIAKKRVQRRQEAPKPKKS